MSGIKRIVKLLCSVAVAILFVVSAAAAGDEAAPTPHMMYFYNPTCRLCTRTNEVVAATEEKYKDAMTFQRFNIADPASGTDNVLYMFDLMDEMQVPENSNTTLVVFVGVLETEDGEVFFTPKRVLVEGDEIIGKLEETVAEFLSSEGKGGTLGAVRPASFFHNHGIRLAHSS